MYRIVLLLIVFTMISCKNENISQSADHFDCYLRIKVDKNFIQVFFIKESNSVEMSYFDYSTQKTNLNILKTTQSQIDSFQRIIKSCTNLRLFSKKKDDTKGKFNIELGVYDDYGQTLSLEFLDVKNFEKEISPQFAGLMAFLSDRNKDVTKILLN